MMTAWVRDRLRQADKDAGVSIVELVISMMIFAFVVVIFLAAINAMSTTTVRAQVVSDTTSQMRTVYQRFDKELRYASEVNAPGTSNGDIYLEYRVPASAGDGDELCVQWRYKTDLNELQRRSWVPTNPSGVSGWSTMVTNLRNDLTDPSQQPFSVRRAGPQSGKIYLRQGVSVYLDAGQGEAGESSGSQLDVDFVALNSTAGSVTNTTPAGTVCLGGGVQRP